MKSDQHGDDVVNPTMDAAGIELEERGGGAPVAAPKASPAPPPTAVKVGLALSLFYAAASLALFFLRWHRGHPVTVGKVHCLPWATLAPGLAAAVLEAPVAVAHVALPRAFPRSRAALAATHLVFAAAHGALTGLGRTGCPSASTRDDIRSARDGVNVLVVLYDDMRPAAGAFDWAQRLGAAAALQDHATVAFDRAYATTSPCSPSRTALLTGLAYRDTLWWGEEGIPDLASQTVPGRLRKKGYYAAFVGKVLHKPIYEGLSPAASREALDYEYLPPKTYNWCVDDAYIGCYGADAEANNADANTVDVAAMTADLVEAHDYLHYVVVGVAKPHWPASSIGDDYHALASSTLTAADVPAGRTTYPLPEYAGDAFTGVCGKTDPCTANTGHSLLDYGGETVDLEQLTDAQLADDDLFMQVLRLYAASGLEAVDRGAAAVQAFARHKWFADRTLVAMTADHGVSIGEGRYVGKTRLYESHARVPLLIALPSVLAGVAYAGATVVGHEWLLASVEFFAAHVGKGGYDGAAPPAPPGNATYALGHGSMVFSDGDAGSPAVTFWDEAAWIPKGVDCACYPNCAGADPAVPPVCDSSDADD